MKTLILLLMTVAGWGQNSPPDSLAYAEWQIKTMQENGSLTNIVNLLISKGLVCEVRGHKWEPGCGIMGCVVYHTGAMRHCSVCGKTQTQAITIGDWK